MSTADTEAVKKLKKHYVYELVDNSGKVFYVGKGSGERALAHEKQAKHSEKSTEKLDKIREIISSDKLTTRVIGRYNTKEEAFSVESTLIHWVYGYDNLSNNTGGHGCDSIRPFGSNEEIEGIDIPERVRCFDGSYSKEGEELREKNNIILFMEDVKSYIEENANITLSNIDKTKSRFTKLFYAIDDGIHIAIGTGHSAKKLLWVELQSVDGKAKNIEKIKKICENSNLEIKNKGAYAKLPGFKSTPSKEDIVIAFNKILHEIEQ